MNGWAFPDPELGPASPGTFLINGRPFADVRYPVDREHVGTVFWQRPNARYSGFRCVASGRYDEIYRNGILEVTYVNPGPPRRVPAQQSWYLCDAAKEGAFPDEERRFRVIGNKRSRRLHSDGSHRLQAAGFRRGNTHRQGLLRLSADPGLGLRLRPSGALRRAPAWRRIDGLRHRRGQRRVVRRTPAGPIHLDDVDVRRCPSPTRASIWSMAYRCSPICANRCRMRGSLNSNASRRQAGCC